MSKLYSGVTIHNVEGRRVKMPKVYLDSENDIINFVSTQLVYFDDLQILYEPEGAIALEIRGREVAFPEEMKKTLHPLLSKIKNATFN